MICKCYTNDASILPQHFTQYLFSNRTINNLSHLLESEHLDIRVTAGEVFALFVETGRTHDKDFLADHYLPKLIDSCRALTVDSNKYRAKRDLKTQRATFRDILRYLEV